MKYYQVIDTIKGCLRLAIVFLYLLIVASVWAVGLLFIPKTTIGILIVTGFVIACLVSIHNTRGMMP